jgi:hypothetical protein
MGAWGTGFFEDDSNCDFLADVLESNASPESFITTFNKGIESEYLETDDGGAIIVSGALLDALMNGTKLKSFDEGLDQWLTSNKGKQVQNLKSVAIKALEKVINEGSELNDLWMENEEEYPVWKKNITELISRLS